MRINETAAVVTGCSSGIGKAVAVHLSAHDFLVLATTRNPSDAKSLSDLRKKNLIPFSPLDLAQQDQIRTAVDAIKSNLQSRSCNGLYGIVHNAGGGFRCSFGAT